MAKISTENAMDDDAQNELRRRARRRLVGAFALALAAVIVLPMVMDHEPRMPVQDIQVRIPSQDGASGIASRILPGKGPTPLPPIAEPVTPVKEQTQPEPRPEPKPAEAKPAEKKKDETDGTRAAAALSGQNSGGAGQWVVQLGAYKEEGNVKLLVKKLKEAGVPSYTEKFESPQGPRTRVRAGPFATKEAAEKAQAKAKAIGVSGSVAPK